MVDKIVYNVKNKQKNRDRIKDLTEEFLAKGGKIQHEEPGWNFKVIHPSKWIHGKYLEEGEI